MHKYPEGGFGMTASDVIPKETEPLLVPGLGSMMKGTWPGVDL